MKFSHMKTDKILLYFYVMSIKSYDECAYFLFYGISQRIQCLREKFITYWDNYEKISLLKIILWFLENYQGILGKYFSVMVLKLQCPVFILGNTILFWLLHNRKELRNTKWKREKKINGRNLVKIKWGVNLR